MRALYIGQMGVGSTCLARAKALEELGWRVDLRDTSPHISSRSRIYDKLHHTFLAGPKVKQLNSHIVNWAKGARDVDVVWIDKGRWIYPETLERIRELPGVLLVHYTPDPALTFHQSRHFLRCIPLYDICVTTKRYELDLYRTNGAHQLVLTQQGVTPHDFHCVRDSDATRHLHGPVFIGHHESHYEKTLTTLASAGVDVHIWGPRWPKATRRNLLLNRCVRGEGLWGDAYTRTLEAAPIGIGLLSKLCNDQSTTRSFEIPAAGALLLAERTDEHLGLFDEGKEADFFSSPEELADKTRFYLSNPAARASLSTAGRRRALGEYTWRNSLLPVTRLVAQISE